MWFVILLWYLCGLCAFLLYMYKERMDPYLTGTHSGMTLGEFLSFGVAACILLGPLFAVFLVLMAWKEDQEAFGNPLVEKGPFYIIQPKKPKE